MHIIINNIRKIACAACVFLLPAIAAENISATESPAPAPASANTVIKGRIIDDEGEPIMGASVMLKGTAFGTSSNLDGEFVYRSVRLQNRAFSQVYRHETGRIYRKTQRERDHHHAS